MACDLELFFIFTKSKLFIIKHVSSDEVINYIILYSFLNSESLSFDAMEVEYLLKSLAIAHLSSTKVPLIMNYCLILSFCLSLIKFIILHIFKHTRGCHCIHVIYN